MSDEQQAPPPPPSDPPPPPPSASTPPPPPPGGSSGSGGAVSSNRTPMLVLSYLWILALIPFLIEKDDQEVRWHAKHGLVLLGAEIVLQIALIIFSTVLAMVDFGCIGTLIWLGFMLVVFVLHIACIVQALGGKRLLIPGVSEFADKF